MSKNYPTFRLRQVARSLAFVLAIIFVMSGTTSRAAAPAFVRHVVNINICSSTTTINIDSALAFTDADGGSDTISVPVGPYLVSGAGATGSVSASQVVLATAGLNNPAGTFGGYATSAYGVRSFTVKISDGTGSDTVRINVHILQQPFTPSISGPYTQLHINDQQLFTGTDYLAASDVARIGAYTTAWSVSGGGVATISNGSAVNEQLARGLALGSATLTYTLSNMCGSSSTTLSFNVVTNVAPTLTGITSTSSLIPGTTYVINGTSFNTTSNNYTIYFGAVKAGTVTATGTTLSVTVPAGATNAPIYVLDNNTKLSSFVTPLAKPTFDNTSFIAATSTNIYGTSIQFNYYSGPATLGGLYSVEYADIDGDGRPDMVCSGTAYDTFVVFRNTSTYGQITNSSFAAPVCFRVSAGPISSRVADLDGDGKLDVVTAGAASGQVSVLRNISTTGNISFAPRFDLACVGILPDEVSIADFNKDGRPDIAVIMTGVRDTATVRGFTPNSDQKHARLIVFKNNYNSSPSVALSANSFDTAAVIFYYDTIAAPISLASGDMNGDGLADIVVSDHQKRQLNIFRNISTPGGAIQFGVPAVASTAAGNGSRASTNSNAPSGSPLAGDYDYASRLTGYPEQVKLGDLDNDGLADIVVAVTDSDLLTTNRYNKIVVFHNISSGSNLTFAAQDTTINTNTTAFPAATTYSNGSTPVALTIADINGDGKLDIINTNAGSGTISIHKNTGGASTYSFGTPVIKAVSGGTGPVCVAVGDVDTNKIPDIAVVSRTANKLHLFRLYPQPDTFAIVADTVMCNASSQTIHTHHGTNPNTLTFWSSTTHHITLGSLADTSAVVTALSPGSDTIYYKIVQLGDTNIISKIIRVSVAAVPPHSVITGANSLCAATNDTLGLSAGVGGGTWTSVNPLVATVSATGIVHGVSAGVDTIRYVVTTTCGNDTAYFTLAVTGLASAPAINGLTRVCISNTITLSPAATIPVGNTYVWHSANPSVSSIDPVTGVVTGVAAGNNTIYYVVTNSCSSDSTSKGDTVSANPTNGTITGTSPLCTTGVTGSQLFTDNASLTNVTSTVWSSSSANATVSNTGLVTGVSAGPATISYAIIGCVTLYDTFHVNVLAPLTAANINGPSRVCIGTPVSLTAAAPVSGTFVWRSMTPSVATISNTGVVTGLTTGFTDIHYVVTNVCGSDSTSQTDSVNQSVILGTITGNHAMCNGTTQTLANTTSNNTYYTTWSTSAPAVATITSPSVNATATIVAAGVGTNAIITQTLYGCSTQTDTFAVNVNAAPSPGVVNGPTRQCIGAGSAISLTHTGANGTWTRFSAATTTLSSAIPASVTVTGLAAGVDTVYYTVVTPGCPDGVIKHIDTVQPNVVVGAITSSAGAGPDTMCIGNSSFTFNDTSTIGLWSSANPLIATVSSVATGPVTIHGISTGLATISYAITAGCGSPIAVIRTVFVRDSVHAGSISGTTPLCNATPFGFTVSGTTGGTWFSSNTAVAGVDAILGTVTGNLTAPAPGADPSAPVTIRYAVSNACNSDTASYGMIIRTQPNPSPITTTGGGNPAGLDSLCIGTTLQQTARPNTSSAPAAGIVSAWTFSNTRATITGAGTVPTTITGASAGLDTLKYTVSNGCGLPVNVTRVIKVKGTIPAGTIVAPSTVCYPTPDFQLYDTLANGDTITDGTWDVVTGTSVFVFPGGLATLPTPNYSSTTVRVIRNDFCGSVQTTKVITVNPGPSAGTTTGNGALCAGTNDTLSNDVFPFGDYWTTSDVSIATVDASGIVTGIAAGTANIYYVDSNACGADTASFTVTVGGLSPTGYIFGQDTSCIGGTAQLFDTVSIAAGGAWSVVSGSAVTIDAVTGVVTALNAGASVIAYTTINGCGPNDTTMTFRVFAAPRLISPKTATSCDSVLFNYTPNSDSLGATFAWTRDTVTGLSNIAGLGTAGVAEYLDDTVNTVVTATYVYVSTFHGCSANDTLKVAVSPTPHLISSLFDTVCSGAPHNYVDIESTTPANATWVRPLAPNITPATGSGTHSINDTLYYGGPATVSGTAQYIYTIGYPGCPTHTETLTTSVNPTPAVPTITTHSPSEVCSMTLDQNFGSATPPPAGVTYTWFATGAQVWATGSTRQYSLVNFTEPGDAVVYLLASIPGLNCPSKDSFPVHVTTSVSDKPEVIYFNGDFVCLANDQDTYQWGYDNRSTLDSELFVGETNQNFTVASPDFTGKYYFVITTHNGCMQKSYYNAPTGVTNVTGSMGEMKLYPNPADQFVNVEINNTPGGKYKVEVVNLLGQTLNAQDLVNNKTTIGVSELASGVYFINCYRDGVKFASAKFVKN